MASHAAASRARRLSSIFSSTKPGAQSPKPAPAPALKAPAGEAESPIPRLSPQSHSSLRKPQTAAAAASPALRLSSIFSSTTPGSQPPKSAPKAPAGVAADAKPATSVPGLRKARRRKILKLKVQDIFRERDPDKLVSQFIAVSTEFAPFRRIHSVYEVAVYRLVSSGRPDAVVALLDSQKPFLDNSRTRKGFPACIIRLYGRASMPSRAAAIFSDLSPKHKSVMNFNALLGAYVDAQDYDAVATAFQEIPAKHPTIVPTVQSYNILIKALCHKPDLPAALDVMTLMDKCGLTPDHFSFTTLMYGFYNNGCLHEAEKIWEMMKERNIEADTMSYNAKLRGLVAGGRIEDAVAVIQRMQNDGPKPDSVSYNELIRGYCKEGRLDEAKKVYDDLLNNDCAPNKSTFKTLVPFLVEAGELDLAVSCCHEIFSRKCRVKLSLIQGVVTALAAASRVGEAMRIVDLCRKKMPSRTEDLKVLPTVPHAGEDNDVEAETDCEDSNIEWKGVKG